MLNENEYGNLKDIPYGTMMVCEDENYISPQGGHGIY